MVQEAIAPLGPCRVQTTGPLGAVAPTTPVTVAVKVMVPPNTGMRVGPVTEIVGVAGVTITSISDVVAIGAKFPSPP